MEGRQILWQFPRSFAELGANPSEKVIHYPVIVYRVVESNSLSERWSTSDFSYKSSPSPISQSNCQSCEGACLEEAEAFGLPSWTVTRCCNSKPSTSHVFFWVRKLLKMDRWPQLEGLLFHRRALTRTCTSSRARRFASTPQFTSSATPSAPSLACCRKMSASSTRFWDAHKMTRLMWQIGT